MKKKKIELLQDLSKKIFNKYLNLKKLKINVFNIYTFIYN